ncbi:hypothetical protein [Prosthecobacter sp.]|uniref:hypothetical protein n=1 Tax=Prosthecobacter sp. TaxID=1965333 RepID=UPI0037846387
MEKVLYHQEFRDPKEFCILKKNPDGTLDVGPEGGPAVVTSVPVVTEPKNGHVTLLVVEEEEKPKGKAKKNAEASK